MEFVCDNMTLEVASSQLMEFKNYCHEMLVGGAAGVQVRDHCTLTINNYYCRSLTGKISLALVQSLPKMRHSQADPPARRPCQVSHESVQ